MVDAPMTIYTESPYMERSSYVTYEEPFATERRANGDVESIAEAAKLELEHKGVVVTEVDITTGKAKVRGTLEVMGEVVMVDVRGDGGSLFLTTRIEFRPDRRERATVQMGLAAHNSVMNWAMRFLRRTGTVEVDGPAVAVTPA